LKELSIMTIKASGQWLARSRQSYRLRPQRRNAGRPRLEQLEDRLTPSTITVSSDADTGANTLRAALATASPGDTIDFAASVRTIDLTSAGLTIGTSVTIQNDLGTGPVIIDGGEQFRVFTVSANVTASLSGLTITHGRAGSDGLGGGIEHNGTALTVTNCTFSDNSATDGGGIDGGDNNIMVVNNCTFTGNTASDGGGIECGTLTVNGCTFSGNIASDGGAIDGGTMTVSNTTFSGNTAADGGAIDCGTLTVSASTFSGNTGTEEGGAIDGGLMMVSNCTFSGNSAAQDGGAIDGGSLTASDSTFTGNRAGVSGGGAGGGIAGGGTLNGVIVAGNFNGASPSTTPDDIFGTCVNSGHNLIGTGGSGGLTNTNGNQVGVSLANVGLAPLGDFGGPTLTCALLPGSFALDAGQTETNAFDQRGVARPNGTPSDVGAVQGLAGQDGVAPAITSANTTTFTGASAGSFTVTDTGSPKPTLSENGILPTGVSFNAATGALAGIPTSYGVFKLQFTAHNGVGVDAVQNFTLTVSGIPSFATTADDRYIAQVYLDLLNRVVDLNGMTFWANQLVRGIPAGEVVLEIEGESTFSEFRGDEVEKLYQHYLLRSADPMALTNDIAFLNGGGTVEQLSVQLIGSPEYFKQRGGSSNSGFLNALYSDALNRPIDPAAQAADLLALSQGTTTGAIAAEVVPSKEYFTGVVDYFYLRFLHRPADSAGQSFYVQQFLGGWTDEEVIASILSSPEYISLTASL
jgi:predicted outer membrane repeat protein